LPKISNLSSDFCHAKRGRLVHYRNVVMQQLLSAAASSLEHVSIAAVHTMNKVFDSKVT